MIEKMLRAMRAPVYTVSIAHPVPEDIASRMGSAPYGPEVEQGLEDSLQAQVVIAYTGLRRMGLRPRRLVGTTTPYGVEARCTVRLADDEAAMDLSERLRRECCEETRVRVVPGNAVATAEAL